MAYAFQQLESGQSGSSVLTFYAVVDSLVAVSSSADSIDTQVAVPKGVSLTAQDDASWEKVEVKAGTIVYQSNRV